MLKLEAIKDFTLKDFNKIKIIERKDKDEQGHIFKEDIFECSEDMANYLTGDNEKNLIVAKIIEQPYKIIEETIKEEKKTIKKNKKSKK